LRPRCFVRPGGVRQRARFASLGYKPVSQAEVNQVINREVLLMAVIETEEGVRETGRRGQGR
jgi:hypothetical protein